MSRLERARSGAFIMSPFSRLRYWWPPPRPRALYRLSGEGPAGAAFSHTSQSFPTDVPGLLPGEWLISVEALDAEGNAVLGKLVSCTIV